MLCNPEMSFSELEQPDFRFMLSSLPGLTARPDLTYLDLTWLSLAATLHSFRVNRGAIRLHNKMITSLMRCKMSFFDSTPSGRILNRLSKDMDSGGYPSSAFCRSLHCY